MDDLSPSGTPKQFTELTASVRTGSSSTEQQGSFLQHHQQLLPPPEERRSTDCTVISSASAATSAAGAVIVRPQTPSFIKLLTESAAAVSNSEDSNTSMEQQTMMIPSSSSSMPLASASLQMPNASIKMETPQTAADCHTCAGCRGRIYDKYLLKAMEKYWHEDCLKCAGCGCRLGEVGSSLFVKRDMVLCRKDYLRMFGATGECAACRQTIPAFEMVMRARKNVYHLECFACQECQHRFCVGDKFYLCDNKILCEYDYEERMVFSQLAYNYSSLAQLKRHIQQVDDLDDVNNTAPVPTR